MTRLIDNFRRSDRSREVDAERGLVLPEMWQPGQYILGTYGTPDRERIQPDFMSMAQQAYGGSAIVFAIILARIALFSEAEFCWQDVKTHELSVSDGSDDIGLLENPWPNGTTGELLVRMEQDVNLTGNAFVRRLHNDRLARLRPDRVQIVSELFELRTDEWYREVMGYLYTALDGSGEPEQFIPVEEMAHWSPIPDPLANFRGMSWMSTVLREVNADLSMTQHKQKFFERAATPNMVIRYPAGVDMNKRKMELLKEQAEARHSGPENAGRTMIIDQGADLTVVGSTFQQMAFSEVQAAGENRITAAAGVPGIVVGLEKGLEAATYSNYEQAMRRFADITMRPEWRSCCAALAHIINVPAGKRLAYDPSRIAALRQGELDRATTFVSKATAVDLLVRGGYDPDSVTKAVNGADLSLLTHTGLLPTTMQKPGEQSSTTGSKPFDPTSIQVADQRPPPVPQDTN